MKNITKNDLVCVLVGVTKSQPVTILARTDSRARKNPYGKIFKVRRINGMVSFDYQAGVERRLAKEGKSKENFSPGESWHKPVEHEGHLTPLCIHKEKREKIYLRLMVNKGLGEPLYFDEHGEELPKEQVKPYLPKKSSYDNQGLDNPLVFTTFDLDNVVEISVENEKYKVIG